MPSQAKSVHLTSAILALIISSAAAKAQEPLAEDTNNLSQIGATTYFESLGWDYQTGSWTNGAPASTDLGSGAAVAILDGLAYEGHADLPYNPDPNVDPYTDSAAFIFTGFPFSPQYTQPSLHGTHVSGIVGGGLNGFGSSGVAPMARLLNYAVFDDNGWIGVDESSVLDSAVSYGATVANMSYGPTSAGDFALSSTLDAIQSHKNEIVAVVAAGNSGVALNNVSFNAPGKSTPLTNLIVVGSVGQDGGIAWYSNTPGNACIISKGSCSVAIRDIFMVAPGGDAVIVYDQNGNPSIASDADGYIGGIWSTSPDGSTSYYRISGTSMAAPHVAGAVALLHSRWPALKLDPESTRQILFDTAIDLGAPGADDVYGQGLLDVNAAMNPIGDPTVGTGGGGSSGGGNGGGKGGGKGGKKKSVTSWSVHETQLRTSHAFAGLAQTHEVISMFDDYNRDFPIAVSSLIQTSNFDLSSKLEQMLSGTAVTDIAGQRYAEPLRGSLGFAHLPWVDAEAPQKEVMMNFSVAGDQAKVFIGRGNAAPLFYQPAVVVGSLGFASSDLGGVNPVLGFAAGDFFTGMSLAPGKKWDFAFGFTQNKSQDILFDPNTEYKSNALAASLTYRISKAMTVNSTITRLAEDNGVLGTRGHGAFNLGDQAQTHAISSSWDWRTKKGFDFSASYTLSVNHSSSVGIMALDGNMYADAFHIAGAKRNFLFDRDKLSVSVSQPLRAVSGHVKLVSDLALDANGIMQEQTSIIPLTPTSREVDLQTDYSLRLDRQTDLSTFAYWAMNSGHMKGEQDAGLGLRLRRKM